MVRRSNPKLPMYNLGKVVTIRPAVGYDDSCRVGQQPLPTTLLQQ